MTKRLCIFSFYDREGIADGYVEFLLSELKSVSERLLIVVNGAITGNSKKLVAKFTDEIYVRDNTGFDAGAYKYVLMNVVGPEQTKAYDEIIFCNDTFFGPFVPLRDIFKDMSNSSCDFWGLTGYFGPTCPFSHIQSYFLVFRKKVITSQVLHEYFEKYIDEITLNISDVYVKFERGLYDYLTRQKGMEANLYSGCEDVDLYKSGYFALRDFGVPIVKKRSFSPDVADDDNMWLTLSYVKYQTDYDIQLVLNCIERLYGYTIREEEILDVKNYDEPAVVRMPAALNTSLKIEDFIGNQEFYIYGCGSYAYFAYWRYAKDNDLFKGFVVSRKEEDKSEFVGYRIYQFSELVIDEKTKFLLAVSKKNADEIMELIKGSVKVENILRIL